MNDFAFTYEANKNSLAVHINLDSKIAVDGCELQ